MGSKSLPEELRQSVKALWLDGTSAGLIANRLGITSNSVIGLVHRMKLPARETKERLPVQNAPKRVHRPKNKSKPKVSAESTGPKMPTPLPVEEVSDTGVTLLTVGSRQCRWPCGLPSADMAVCGQPVYQGPYCETHHRKARVPLRPGAKANITDEGRRAERAAGLARVFGGG